MSNFIDRAGAEALIPEEETKTIIQGAIAQSAVLSHGKKLPNMASKTSSMPVLSMLPEAFFVDGDTGLAQTTKVMWDKKKIVAAPLAVIVPIPNDVLDDMQDNGYDFDGEVLPRIYEAVGKAIDGAIIWGVNKPAEWRASLVDSIVNTDNAVQSSGDLYDDIMSEGGMFAKVEANGFECNAVIAPVTFKASLRSLRDDTGKPIFTKDMQTANSYALDGNPCHFITNGSWDTTRAKAITGDFNNLVYAFRKDMTAQLLTEAVITDSNKQIIYNLAQQRMCALMVTLRIGWELPNPINAQNPDDKTRLPFALLAPDSGLKGHKLTITVTNEENTPIEGADIDLSNTPDLTDDTGKAIYEKLTDGSYILTVKKDGYKTNKKKVAINGEDKSVTVKLVAED